MPTVRTNSIKRVENSTPLLDVNFEHTPKAAISGVRAIRFTITKDEANAGCVALSEIYVE